MKQENEWDLIIEPKRKLKLLDFFQFIHYKDLLFLFVRRDFVAHYKQTVLGPLWLVLQPLFSSLVFWIIFNKVAKVGTDKIPPFLFYLCGTITWTFFSETLTKTATVFKDNAQLLGKVFFPRLVVPISILMGNCIRLGIQMVLFSVFYILELLLYGWDASISIYVVFIPLILMVVGLFAFSVGLMLASITVRYRDLAFLVGFGVQLFLFLTPVLYPITKAPENIAYWLWKNPLSAPFETLRFCIFGEGLVSFTSWLYTFVLLFFLLFIGSFSFLKMEKKFTDSI